MRTQDILEHCLQALKAGEDISPEVARYLARNPEQRVEVEELLYIAGQASQLPSVELSSHARARLSSRLASKLGFDPAALDRAASTTEADVLDEGIAPARKRKKPWLMVGRLSLARLRYEPPARPDPLSEARIREVFRDLTPDDIGRYIGVRGIQYLQYRQKFYGWRPLFTLIAALLRGMKRVERFVVVEIRDGY
jgi:hypothetical protein